MVDTKEWLLNLHDVYLNASAQHEAMRKSPVVPDIDEGIASDRFRYERAWIMFLYVLVEAWRADGASSLRQTAGTAKAFPALEATLCEGDSCGLIKGMRNTRDYMCHRDRREYWDAGRVAPFGNLEFHTRLHMAFGNLLLELLGAAASTTAQSRSPNP